MTIVIFTSDARPDGVKHKEIMMESQRYFESVILLINNPLEFLVVTDPVKNHIQSLELVDLGTLALALGIPKI